MTRPAPSPGQWPVIDGRELLAWLAEFERRVLADVTPEAPEVPR